MNKLISIFFLSLLSLLSFKDSEISITSNLPADIHAGDTYTVVIKINKLSLHHYAVLEQKLPKGFKAVEKQSGAANFSFSNGVVKFTWLRLPESSPLTISYDIVADKSMKKGKYNLSTEFVYIYRNYRGSVSLPNSTIKVYNPSEVLETDKSIPKDPQKVQSLRFTPQYSAARRALVVQIMISRGMVQGKAKITENIPIGYSAKAIDTKGAYFQVNKNNVEFIWNKLPTEKNFIISYMLSPHKEKSPLPNITGLFRFRLNNQIKDVHTKQAPYTKPQKSKKQDVNKEEIIDYFGSY